MSVEWGTRPSEFLDITDPYKAWCLDEAIHQFGTTGDSMMAKAKGRNEKARAASAENILRSYLGLKKKYRDAMDLVSRAKTSRTVEADRPEPQFKME